jgi:hypothetical protein
MTATKFLAASLTAVAVLWGGWMLFAPQKHPLPSSTHLYTAKQMRCYRLSYRQKIFNFLLGDTPAPTHTLLDAKLCLKITAIDSQQVEATIQLYGIDLQTRPPQRQLTDHLSRYYARPVSATFSPDGRILDLRFPGKAANYAGYRQMLQQMELITGEHDQTLTQHDELGTYQTRYLYKPGSIHRQKMRYTAASQTHRILLYHSDANGTYDNGYTTLNLHEKLRILDGNEKIAQIHTDIHMEPVDEDDPRPGSMTSIPEVKRAEMVQNDSDLFETLRNANKREAFSKKGIDATSLLASIHADPNDPKRYNELEDYLRLYPDKIASVRTALKQADNTEARNLIATLDALNLPAAQAILADLAADPDAVTMNRIRSIIALGGQTKPAPEVLQALSELTEETETEVETDLANTAQLAIGSLCRDPEIAAQYGDRIRDALTAASTYTEAKIALLTAKNAGTVTYIDAILPYVHHHDARLRKWAITILTPHLNAEIDMAFQKQMEVENVPEVRALLRTKHQGHL